MSPDQIEVGRWYFREGAAPRKACRIEEQGRLNYLIFGVTSCVPMYIALEEFASWAEREFSPEGSSLLEELPSERRRCETAQVRGGLIGRLFARCATTVLAWRDALWPSASLGVAKTEEELEALLRGS